MHRFAVVTSPYASTYSLLTSDSIAPEYFTILKNRIINMADFYITGVSGSAYQMVMGKSSRDFNWGSNSNAANQGIALI